MKTKQFNIAKSIKKIFTNFENKLDIAIIRDSKSNIKILIIVKVFEILIDIN